MSSYLHFELCLLSMWLIVLVILFVVGILAVGLRTAAAAYLVSYWGWAEAVAVVACIELADLAFLLRWVWTRENGRADWLAGFGMILGISSSIAFSVLLAFVATERLALGTRAAGQAAAIIAAIGVNVVTYLLGREVAVYVVEFERTHAEWETDRLEWKNRVLARAESKAERERRKAEEVERLRRPVRTAQEREERMLELYMTRPVWSQTELENALGCGHTAAYGLRKRLVAQGRLVARDGGGWMVNVDG